jgi:hypothetical protein
MTTLERLQKIQYKVTLYPAASAPVVWLTSPGSYPVNHDKHDPRKGCYFRDAAGNSVSLSGGVVVVESIPA